MQIITHINDHQRAVAVGNVSAGGCVRFLHPFHQDYSRADRYIVNDIISSYRPHSSKHEGKTGVTNLTTGKLSYVEPTRECIFLPDAEVVTNEE